MISLRRLHLIAGIIILIIGLDWSYVNIVSPVFAYEGFVYYQPPIRYWILPTLLAILPVLWMPLKLQRPSQAINWILYLTVLIPSLFIPYYALASDLNELIPLDIALFLCMALISQSHRLKLIRLNRQPASTRMFWTVIFLASAFVFALQFANFGVRLAYLDVTDVYGQRAEYARILETHSSFSDYLLNWQGNVIDPVMIIYGILNSSFPLMIIGLVGQYTLYSISGNKEIFFSALMIVGFIAAQRKGGSNFGVYLIWGSVAMVIVCNAAFIISGNIIPTAMLTERLFHVNGLLTGYYYDFFSHNPLTLLSQSLLNPFMKNPYDMTTPHLIGQAYLNDRMTSANANLWADAYSNIGFAGMFIFSGLLVIYEWIYDSLTVKLDYRLSTALLGLPAVILANAGLHTALLTHGLALILVVAFIAPSVTVRLGSARIARKHGTGLMNRKSGVI